MPMGFCLGAGSLSMIFSMLSEAMSLLSKYVTAGRQSKILAVLTVRVCMPETED
jgi:hypothetical protein